MFDGLCYKMGNRFVNSTRNFSYVSNCLSRNATDKKILELKDKSNGYLGGSFSYV